MPKDYSIEEEMLKRLEVLIAINLQLFSKKKVELDIRGQIEFLSNLNLSATSIARILGKSNNYINKELFYIRKK
jgi:hypothetical protein